MPGWHARTLELQKAGKLQLVGIIEEQHPDRARLFMQWKEMGWPLLVDSLNLLQVPAVPITVLLDEHGVVRQKKPTLESILEVVDTPFPAPADEAPPLEGAPSPGVSAAEMEASASSSGEAIAWQRAGDAWYLAAGGAGWIAEGAPGEAAASIERAIAAYRMALERGAGAVCRFHLGVALRRRYESPAREPDDFQAAVSNWAEALALDPNQYIWRRRIEQYGPRLDKPYAFYDWVDEARRAIRARGEDPAAMHVEPRGAELASPTKDLAAAAAPGARGEAADPDPQGRIARDDAPLVRVETAVVPGIVSKGRTARLHATFRVNGALDAHWNNEAGGLLLHVAAPEGVELSSPTVRLANPPDPSSTEPREVEVEVRLADGSPPGRRKIEAYALYYVCEGKSGVCRYLRKDIVFEVDLGR